MLYYSMSELILLPISLGAEIKKTYRNQFMYVTVVKSFPKGLCGNFLQLILHNYFNRSLLFCSLVENLRYGGVGR